MTRFDQIKAKKVQKKAKKAKISKEVRWQVWHIDLGCLWVQKSKQAFLLSSDQKTKAKKGQIWP